MCRHTVGLNYVAIGIEHVGTSDAEILHDRAQIRASLELTAWLVDRFHIRIRNVIGHNESLSSPYHRERYKPWAHQTHSDWKHADMRSTAGSSEPFSAPTRGDRLAAMPRYLIVRSFEVGEDQMPPIGRRSRELTETEFAEITWEHSHVVVDDEGSCTRTASTRRRTSTSSATTRAGSGGTRSTSLHEIAGDVTPADFPPV